MQTDKGKATTVSRKELPYFTIPVTDRHYMVVRAVKVTEENSPGIYRSTEFWTTSFFYISDLGANYWIGYLGSLVRYLSGDKTIGRVFTCQNHIYQNPDQKLRSG